MTNHPDRQPVLAAGLRLPQARAGGRYAAEDPGHLGAALLREFLARLDLDAGRLDEVIVGCVGAPHDQANVARVIALRAGIPRHVPAFTVARNCASGMQAVTSAMDRIQAGRGDLFISLGVEVMSGYPLVFNQAGRDFFQGLASARTPLAKAGAALRLRPAALAPRVALTEGLTDPISGLIMGSTAEHLARDFGIDRETSDRYALTSHVRAATARDAGRFQREILPYLPLGSGPKEGALVADDGIRDNQTPEALAKLRPYFEKPDGVVTVGNACGITDGATVLLITSRSRAEALGLKPLAILKDYAWSGCDPARMGLGPVFSTAKLLKQTGVRLQDIGAVELNEAFAVQVLACQQAFASPRFASDQLSATGALGEIDPARLNKNGGAIALGHPVGATGARLLLTAAHELAVSDCELSLATLCIGGGQGGAVLLKRL